MRRVAQEFGEDDPDTSDEEARFINTSVFFY